MSEGETTKGPWIWKAAIVFLPTGLAISAAIAMWMKVSGGTNDEMVKLNYLASEFDSKSLRDATSKLEDLVGERGYVGESSQIGLRRAAALIEGTVGPNNLGYKVESDKGLTKEGRIWKNYWIDGKEKGGGGVVLLWADYSRMEESASVSALLSLAEWMRGRDFEKKIRVAFLHNEEELPVVTSDLKTRQSVELIQVHGLGMGSNGVSFTAASEQATTFLFQGAKEGAPGQTDWKLTTSWEHFEAQVRTLCERVSESAVERVIFGDEG